MYLAFVNYKKIRDSCSLKSMLNPIFMEMIKTESYASKKLYLNWVKDAKYIVLDWTNK